MTNRFLSMEYFDHNATTPLFPEAEDALLHAVKFDWLNPSSAYREAARVHGLLEQCREQVAAFLDSPSRNIIFNSGATESNNAIFKYFHRLYGEGKRVLISSIEHPSVAKSADFWFRENVCRVPVTGNGVVDLEMIEKEISLGDVVLVSVMALNNETGIVQPWKTLSALCREKGVVYHCDASQWIGKLPLEGLHKCDLLVACAHKFGGPKGAGFLAFSGRVEGFRFNEGGGQESSFRSGTVDYPGIASMTKALEVANRNLVEVSSRQEGLRNQFEEHLATEIPELITVGQASPRVWNTSELILPVGESSRWINHLDRRGFAVSAGSACSSGEIHQSESLAAMGFSEVELRRTIRVSGGWNTGAESWHRLGEAFVDVYGVLKEEEENGRANGSYVISI